MLGSELISSTAVFIAIVETLPLMLLEVKMAPMLTVSVCEYTTENAPITNSIHPKYNITKLLMALEIDMNMETSSNNSDEQKGSFEIKIN